MVVVRAADSKIVQLSRKEVLGAQVGEQKSKMLQTGKWSGLDENKLVNHMSRVARL